jgi:hypothetical protein
VLADLDRQRRQLSHLMPRRRANRLELGVAEDMTATAALGPVLDDLRHPLDRKQRPPVTGMTRLPALPPPRPARTTPLAEPRRGRGSAAATSCASHASAAAPAPQPAPPTPPAEHPAPPTEPTTPAAPRPPARAPARRSPPPPSAPHRLIRRPESGPYRLNAYTFLFGSTCKISSVRQVWSPLWSLQVRNAPRGSR